MVTANGTFTKKAYCDNCFNVVEWDGPDAQKSILGHRVVKCPECGAYINVEKNFEVIEKDVIENPKGYVNGKAYETAAAAISAAQPGDTVTLGADETISYLSLKKDMTLDLNGHTLTTSYTVYPKGNAVINNGTLKSTGSSDLIYVTSGNNLTMNNVEFSSRRNGITVDSGSTLELNDCTGSAQEAMIYTNGNGNVVVNGGEYTSIDNGVVMDNGSSGKGGNHIVINDGHFIGHITSAGYLAHIIYLANDDTLDIKDGTFEVENGSAIVVRAGKLNVSTKVKITATGNVSGKVGDGAQLIPAGHDIVIDTKSNYPAVASLNVQAPGKDIFKIEA